MVSGDVYGSSMLASVGSRPLREAEMHGRAQKLGCTFDAQPSWRQVPMLADYTETDSFLFREFPIMLVSSLVTWHLSLWQL